MIGKRECWYMAILMTLILAITVTPVLSFAQTSKPEIIFTGFPSEIEVGVAGNYGYMSFKDSDKDLSGVRFEVISGQATNLDIAPSWQFDPDMQGKASGTIQFTIAALVPGQYQLQVILVDATGNESVPEVIAFVAKGGAGNLPPIAVFSVSPAAAKVGESIIFDASASSDVDGAIVSFEWEFGDVSSDAGQQVTHVYDSEGTYTVALVVTDAAGATDRRVQQVVVEAPFVWGTGLYEPIDPFSLAIGGTAYENVGVFSVDNGNRLIHYGWEQGDGWQREVIDTGGVGIEPGSLISDFRKVVGVAKVGTGQPCCTWMDGDTVRFGFLTPSQSTDIVPGSLALGGSVEDNVGIFAVDNQDRLIRYWWELDYGWHREVIDTGGVGIEPGSLISDFRKVVGVAKVGTGQPCCTWMDGDTVRFGFLTPSQSTDIVPGSLALGGNAQNNIGIFAVNNANRLVRYWWEVGYNWHREVIDTEGMEVEAGSLISGARAIYGVTRRGAVFRAFGKGAGTQFELLLPAPTGCDIAPGSLAIGKGQDDPHGEAGLFAVGTNGVFYRYYTDPSTGRWAREKIRTEGHKVVAGSLVSRQLSVYGVTENGRVCETWQDGWGLDGGHVQFGLLLEQTGTYGD